jgi:signal transduction histidine kinase/DNA-binding response OmpR family regulator/CHASE1-domain containing sensor protein
MKHAVTPTVNKLTHFFMNRSTYGWVTGVVAVIGLSFTLAFYSVQRNLEAQRHTETIKHYASDYAATIRDRFLLVGERMMAVRHLLTAVPSVTEPQFIDFVQPTMESRLAVQTIEWAPRIKAATATEYDRFPVRFMEPYVGDAPPVGLDLAADPVRRAVMDAARDSGELAAVMPVVRVRAERQQVSVLLLLPVYVRGAALDTVLQRQEALTGFVTALVRIDPLIELALAGQGVRMFDLALIDPAAAPDSAALISFRADKSSKPIPIRELKSHTDTVAMPIMLAGLEWQLLVMPAPALAKFEGVSIALLLLGFGICAILSTVFIIHLLLAGNRRVTALVTKKTAELRESAERTAFQRTLLASLIEASPTGVLVASPDRRWILWNLHFLTIWSIPVEIIKQSESHNALDFMLPQLADPDGFMQRVDQIYGQPELHRRDEILLKDGRVFERHTAPVIGEDGTVHGRSWFYQDITERTLFQNELLNARDAAETASRAKSEFLATISHEIRTPMNGVLGMTDLLQMTEMNDEQQEYLKIIKDSGASLLVILNDILDYSKIEAGKMEIEARPFSPVALLNETSALMLGRAMEKQIELRIAIDEDTSLQVLGDANRLRQVLVNLIGNAIKFTHQGCIDLRLQVAERENATLHLRFDIADTGIGIAPEVVPKLFMPFFQADSSTTRRFGGTGLGLAICKRLIDAMGGHIGVESREGQGSRFWFDLILPQVEVRASPSAALTGGLARASDWNGCTVLVVEDNPINARVASELLEKNGLRVTVAENGALALDAYLANPPDLILMDVQMPVMGGHEATQRIRALEAENSSSPRHVPIVAFTANAFDNDRVLAMDAGMDDFIAKPFREANFIATLARWLPSPNQTHQTHQFNQKSSATPPPATRTSGDEIADVVFDSAMLLEITAGAGIQPMELVDLFLEDAGQTLSDLETAIDGNDRASAERCAHTLKSTCASVGANRLQKLALTVEQALRVALGDDARTQVAALRAELALYRQTVEARRPELS